MADGEMTEDEIAARLAQQLYGQNIPQNTQHSVHAFLNNVAKANDTTKTGYLNEEELGLPKLPERTLKELALFCEDVANMDYFAEYFRKKAEILTSTSLSKDAKLLSLAVLTKREVADVTKRRTVKKGWFKKKEQSIPEQQI